MNGKRRTKDGTGYPAAGQNGENAVLPAFGLFASVFAYMSAGFLLFSLTSLPDIVFTLLCAALLFTVAITGAGSQTKGADDYFEGAAGKTPGALIASLLALASLITIFSDGKQIVHSVSSLCDIPQRAVGIGFAFLVVLATLCGAETVFHLSQSGMILFLAAGAVALFYVSRQDAFSLAFHPSLALRAFGGSGVFFFLVSRTRLNGDEKEEKGNEEDDEEDVKNGEQTRDEKTAGISRSKGKSKMRKASMPRRLRVFLLMFSASVCAALFSSLILFTGKADKMKTFFEFLIWCLSFVRLSLLFSSVLDYGKTVRTPLTKAIFCASLWGAWTVMASAPFPSRAPFSGGLILAVCLNLIPLLLLTLFSLVIGSDDGHI